MGKGIGVILMFLLFIFFLFIMLIPPGTRYRGFIDRTLQHTEGDPISEFIRFIIL
jgi:hypothetical protein